MAQTSYKCYFATVSVVLLQIQAVLSKHAIAFQGFLSCWSCPSRFETEDQGEELLIRELDPPIPVGVKLLEGVGQGLERQKRRTVPLQETPITTHTYTRT